MKNTQKKILLRLFFNLRKHRGKAALLQARATKRQKVALKGFKKKRQENKKILDL